jgi:hypothetical protein
MYRVLAANAEVRERRNQLRHPAYHKPELLATGPNQVWSWDITKLLGPVKWTYYYLYVLLDIFSRYVVGWLHEERFIGLPPAQVWAQVLDALGLARATFYRRSRPAGDARAVCGAVPRRAAPWRRPPSRSAACTQLCTSAAAASPPPVRPPPPPSPARPWAHPVSPSTINSG